MNTRPPEFANPTPFDEVFRSEGMNIIQTPIRALNANAYAERWVGTLRRECLDRILIVNRRQLEHVLPNTSAPAGATARHIRKHELPGGLIHEYEAAA
jgi:putative transposase